MRAWSPSVTLFATGEGTKLAASVVSGRVAVDLYTQKKEFIQTEELVAGERAPILAEYIRRVPIVTSFFDANIFYPAPFALAFSEHLLPQAIQIFPVYAISRNPMYVGLSGLLVANAMRLGAWKALMLLWRGDERSDLESYVAIHQGTIFGSLTLVTGAIWAKASWGKWWVWDSNQLVLFLVLFLFYCAYFMLRFSIEPGPRRDRISAVYALFGVALIPVSFFAIRLANDFIHPTVFTRDGPQMSGDMFFTFCVCLAGTMRTR